MEKEKLQIKFSPYLQRSLKKNAFFNTVRTLMGIIFPLITFPYASRVLLPEGIGKVNFARTIVQYFALLGSLGISTHGAREVARCRDDRVLLSKRVREIFVINMTATVAAYAVFFAALFLVPRFSRIRALLCVYSAAILFTTLGMEWLYAGLEDYVYMTVRAALFQLASLALLLALVRTEDDCLRYAGISVFANVGANICNFIHSRKYLVRVRERLEFKAHLKPVLILFAKSLAVSIYTMLDVAMLGFMAGDGSVGIYTTATKITKTVESLVVAATAVFAPRLSYYAGTGESGKFNSLLTRSLNFLLMFSIPCAAGLAILARPLVLVFGGAMYEAAVPVMQIMCPLLLIIAVSNFTGSQIFVPLGKEKHILVSTVAGAAVNFSLNFALIPRLGVRGAGIASVAAEGCVTATQLAVAGRYFPFAGILKPILHYILGTVAFCAPVYFLSRMIPNTVLSVFVCAFAGAAIYSLVLLAARNEFFMEVLGAVRYRVRRRRDGRM